MENMLRLTLCGRSDTGLKRSNNEDAFLVDSHLRLCALADGMGGAAAGEVASQIFTRAVQDVFSRSAARNEGKTISLMQRAYEVANQEMLEHAAKSVQLRGMGCTAELLVFDDYKFSVAHIGDSRTYLFRNGELRQLTRDHSLVQEQVEQGLLTKAEARNHRLKNIILRAVGTSDTLTVDLIRGEVVPGDIFLLCSDGLTDMVDEESIRRFLALPMGVVEKAEQLINAAKLAGGLDNITVVVCEVLDD